MNPLVPQPPFVWPEPRVIAQMRTYEHEPPYGALAHESKSVFGVVSALTLRAVAVLESWLTVNPDLRVSLIIAVYPACATRETDIIRLLQVAKSNSERVSIHIYPLARITDRATNALCFLKKLSDVVHLVTGPSEDLGLGPCQDGQANFALRADPVLVEAFTRHFEWLWAHSQDITVEGVTAIPDLILPAGTEAGARLWQDYLDLCLGGTLFVEAQSRSAQVDPDTGSIAIVSSEGKAIPSPTEALGFPKLDAMAERMARLYEKGALVSLDKLSKIPPLDAPLDPRLFGERTEVQSGKITRKVSMRISVIDERDLIELNKRKQEARTLLTKFAYGLADNMRWMPFTARALYEAEMARINAEGKAFVATLLKGGVDAFIDARLGSVVDDINAMYAELGRRGKVPDDVVSHIVDSLKERLSKADAANFVPTLSYSTISFASTETALASPWGQAYSLLSDIVRFPRKALTDYFFWRGLRVRSDDLLEAMNVADDALCCDFRVRGIEDRCRAELALLSEIELASIESRDRCELMWRILAGDSLEVITEALRQAEEPSQAEMS